MTKQKRVEDILDISELDKAAVLVALYNAARPPKSFIAGFIYPAGDLPHNVAEDALSLGMVVNGLCGRIIAVDFSQDSISAWFYDQVNGQGAARRAITPLWAQLQY